MMNIPFNALKRVHFIGINGISMSALAKFCLVKGISVSGSDNVYNDVSKRLNSLGAKIYKGHKAENLFSGENELPDAVVYTSAIDLNNPELVFALKSGIKVYKRSEFLAEIVDGFSVSVGVAGSHGKTTATCMIADIMVRAGKSPTVFLGGDSYSFGNFLSGKDEIAIYEACEFQRNFLDFHPKYSVVLNIDNDHMDTYKDISDETAAFKDYVSKSVCFVNADDKQAKTIYNSATITFGIDGLSVYTAKNIKITEKGTAFTVYAYCRKLGRINIKLFGKHFVYDALSAIAVACELKVPFKTVSDALTEFKGIKRRNEFLGHINSVQCFADYAHHPTEICANAKYNDGKTLAVFQPHTYSRTEKLMNDFIDALSNYDGVIIYKTYPAREKFNLSGDAKTLYGKLKKTHKNTIYCGDAESLFGAVGKHASEYDKVIFIGAGDIYDIAKEIILKNM